MLEYDRLPAFLIAFAAVCAPAAVAWWCRGRAELAADRAEAACGRALVIEQRVIEAVRRARKAAGEFRDHGRGI